VNSSSEKYCVVDAGNTQIKVVEFYNDEILQQQTIPLEDRNEIASTLIQLRPHKSILSSVLSKEDSQWLEECLKPHVVLNNSTALPISISDYKTPLTLGADRIANAVAAHHYSKTENALVIDTGTCIKFDLILGNKYQGGSISPGYAMRFKAMHDYTGALPNLEIEEINDFIGRSTKESMLSGVMNGIQAEINGFVAHYSQEYGPLTIFLTGGDYKRFDIVGKSSIFADNNLTVKGLYIILKHNV